jgi:hypothetical protein
MKRTTRSSVGIQQTGAVALAEADGSVNGQNGQSQPSQIEIRALLRGLQAMRDGDFSVRLPGDWTGLEGKIADAFNEIVAANQQMALELKRVGHVVGKEGKTRERTKFAQSKGAWGEMEVSVNTLVDDLLRPTTEVTRAIGAVAQGDLRQTVRLDVDGRPLGHHRQHDDPAAWRVHVRGDARGARGGDGREIRRAGAGAGGQRRLEGFDRERQLDGE